MSCRGEGVMSSSMRVFTPDAILPFYSTLFQIECSSNLILECLFCRI